MSIRAEWDRLRAVLKGAGRPYIPEEERQRVEALMRAAHRRALVDRRVDDWGTVALLRRRAGGETFGA